MAKLTLSLGSNPLKSLFLTGRGILIGADPACDISIDDLSLRPVHARIAYTGSGYHLAATVGDQELQVNHGSVH